MLAEGSLASYYAKRAREYERIYDKPERQERLAKLRAFFAATLAGRDVLEVACGTGYWTQVCARTARSITATDINEETLAIARAKDYGSCPVSFLVADAFRLPSAPTSFNAGLAAFWWSHLKLSETAAFLTGFHAALTPGARVLLMDNQFVAGSSTPTSRTDSERNTYQQRRLDSGETCEVLKNFPDEARLRGQLAPFAEDLRWHDFEYYWCATYRIGAGKPGWT